MRGSRVVLMSMGAEMAAIRRVVAGDQVAPMRVTLN